MKKILFLMLGFIALSIATSCGGHKTDDSVVNDSDTLVVVDSVAQADSACVVVDSVEAVD